MSAFGICPFCGSPLGWSNDEEHFDDPEIVVRYLMCMNCGTSVEAVQCPKEERKNYPYWNED